MKFYMRSKKFLSIYIIFIILIVSFSGCVKQTDNSSNKNVTNEDTLTANQHSQNNKSKKPVVPDGFKKVNTENASWEEVDGVVTGWNNGLVIEDENQNQFVWVPCSIEENSEGAQYSRYYSHTYETIKRGDEKIIHIRVSDSLESDNVRYYYYYEDDPINEEIKEMVNKYGGFYIGRYETGKNTSDNKAVVKSGYEVINNITAVEAIETSKSIVNTDNAKTYMMTSYCFDTTIRWLEKSDQEVKNKMYDYFANHRTKGPKLSKTGANEYDNVKNIYDLLGNAGEFTTEKYHSDKENDTYTNRGRGILKFQLDSIKNASETVRTSTIISALYEDRSQFGGKSEAIGSRVVLVVK